VAQIRGSGCAHTTALCGRSTTERGVNAPLVKVDGKSVKLALQVQTIPEEDLIQKLAPHGPDKPVIRKNRSGASSCERVFMMQAAEN
jgi:hypothetical protein